MSGSGAGTARRRPGAAHLLAVAAEASHFAPLMQALAAAGLRAGWLELRPPQPIVPGLAAATAAGARRAVAVGGGHSVAVKTMGGPPVLRDLLREHFAGCAVVLVYAAAAAPPAPAAPPSPPPVPAAPAPSCSGNATGNAGAPAASPPVPSAAGALESLPLLRPEGDDAWSIRTAAAGTRIDAVRHLDTASLIAELRRPHPWQKPARPARPAKAPQDDDPR